MNERAIEGVPNCVKKAKKQRETNENILFEQNILSHILGTMDEVVRFAHLILIGTLNRLGRPCQAIRNGNWVGYTIR